MLRFFGNTHVFCPKPDCRRAGGAVLGSCKCVWPYMLWFLGEAKVLGPRCCGILIKHIWFALNGAVFGPHPGLLPCVPLGRQVRRCCEDCSEAFEVVVA
jgi:hypothetical protein